MEVVGENFPYLKRDSPSRERGEAFLSAWISVMERERLAEAS